MTPEITSTVWLPGGVQSMSSPRAGIFCFGLSVLEHTMSEKEEMVTHNLEKKQLIETGLQMTHVLELADKNF